MRRKRNRKSLPINLLRKQQREQRHLADGKKKPRRRNLNKKLDSERRNHEALVRTTEIHLEKILQANEVLSDIPYDCTPQELMGEIAIANGYATTIYVERDGLSTLTIILPQKNPTIANLKRAIESTARVQHKRELRERYESRRRRRRTSVSEETGNASNSNDDSVNADKQAAAYQNWQQQQFRQQVETTAAWLAANRSTGELVYSTTRCGHPHRTTVSWRFLWRAYMLIDVQTKTPLYDEDGRKLLIDCDIENGATLRFCKREIYMKRRRQ
ncbi:uncharacterized protein LOC128863075 isoform X1 [Anastrepha ludens]|uniref:uncharacterized protein LOC128863075 isoform X1 n=1 Tax=Anastrepha ludens TaxID=28586 RepID=UPI0023AE99E5|nr:uncharacterized protein LOC128863075 isoform X1 [Anastrepha ludens]